MEIKCQPFGSWYILSLICWLASLAWGSRQDWNLLWDLYNCSDSWAWCVLSYMTRMPASAGPNHKNWGNKNQQVQCFLMSSSLSFLSQAFHPSLLSSACSVEFKVWHQLQRQQAYRGFLTHSSNCSRSSLCNKSFCICFIHPTGS